MGPLDVEALVERTLAGEDGAWQTLWQAVEPRLYAMLRRPNLIGRLSQSEDECRSIVVEVMARLRANDFARLRSYVAARRDSPKMPFMAWILVVAKRVAIDHVRAHETYIDRRHIKDASSPGAWREIDALPSDSQIPGERPPVTNRGTAHELLAFAESDLPADQRAALEAWLGGSTFEEMASQEHGGDAREAEKLVRAALQRLRRQFRDG